MGIPTVPFHPDEATYLFMAADFEKLMSDPVALQYQGTAPQEAEQRYRLIDAPLSRYLIGAGLWATGKAPLAVDWDWSKSWEENEAMGALPDPQALTVSRLSVASLTLVSMVLAYAVSRRMHGKLAGSIAFLLLGTSALVLLHTRRAMAESALLFSIYLILWLLPKAGRYPILIGLASGLALCAKQSALPTIGIAALAVIILSGNSANASWRRRLSNLAVFAGAALLVFFLLNPVFWGDPFQVLIQAFESRQELLARQLADWGNYSLFQQPLTSVLLFWGNLFYTPPAFAEAANYLAATHNAEMAYLSNALNNSLRGVVAGSVLFSLFIVGIILAFRHTTKQTVNRKRELSLYLAGTVLQILFVLLFLPIPWQRYVLPVLPYAFIWIAYAVSVLITEVAKKFSPTARSGRNERIK